MKDGLHLFDPALGTCRHTADVPGEPEGNRLNDACVDSRGRVYFGSMDDGEEGDSGRSSSARCGATMR